MEEKGMFLYEYIYEYQNLKRNNTLNDFGENAAEKIYGCFFNKLLEYGKKNINVETHYLDFWQPSCQDSYTSDIFRKYNHIPFIKVIDYTDDSWYTIIYAKLLNLYNNYCNKDYIYNERYIYLLRTPKRLYFKWLKNKKEDYPAHEDYESECEKAMEEADKLKQKLQNEKMNVSWEDFIEWAKTVIKKTFNNYIPLDEFEDKTKFVLDTDLWTEDNFAEKYICKWLDCEMKQWQKRYYGIGRLKKDEKIKRCDDCGTLFVIKKKDNRTIRCDNCRKIHKKELRKAQNQRYYNHTKIKYVSNDKIIGK
mgnify:FL=1